LISVKIAETTYPTGKKDFAVWQPFPSAFVENETDPFLMCDEFGPTLSTGIIEDPDTFQVDWHPHRGMDIVTYLRKGVGRHADSLGNRGIFQSPGMQWISVGSGIEHAEGGGTPANEYTHGFQIWVNVPSSKKMDDPRYGTEPPENIPILKTDGGSARILAGTVGSLQGPFKTVQSVQILDITININSHFFHQVPIELDTCIIYIFEGEGIIAGTSVKPGNVIKLDATLENARFITFKSTKEKSLSAMFFAGKRLNEPIKWHGPIVMNTQKEIDQALYEYRHGTFLRKRAPWNYRKFSDFSK